MRRNKDIANFKTSTELHSDQWEFFVEQEVVFWVKVIRMNAAEVGFLPNYQIGALQG